MKKRMENNAIFDDEVEYMEEDEDDLEADEELEDQETVDSQDKYL